MKSVRRLRRIFAARKKTGRKTFSYTVALTPEQIQWLTERYTNSSKLFRRLLDDHIQLMDKTEPDSVKLGYTLKRLVAEKEVKEKEMEEPQREYERAWALLQHAENEEKRLRKFLETPEEQVEINLRDFAYVTLPNAEKTGEVDFTFKYNGENRQYFLDKVRRIAEKLDQPEYKQKMKRMKEKKDITEKIYNAFVKNIELLDKEINDIRQKINLINKQTNNVV